jgi:hypothetical protein
MNRLPCEQLDDYLLGWLPPDEAAVFERHLAVCPACHREQTLQRAVDARFAKISESLDVIPSGLVERTRKEIHAARRRRAWRWTLSLAASAAVIWVVIVTQFRPGDFGRPEGQGISAAPPKIPSGADGQWTVSSLVTLTDPSAGIVVESKTRDPKISVVWIYPTVKPPAPAGGGSINGIFPPQKGGEYL